MFRLNRHKSDRSGEKVEFRFSNLQAFQVPKGWDRLLLSIISVETGKTIAKSSKATVRGGTCQWTGPEVIWISQDDASKELEESQIKFVLSMGSARSVILGEIVLNLADYLSSEDSGSLLLPLKKCESGITLQVKIQCTTPKSKFSHEKNWRETTSHFEGLNTNNFGTSIKSDASDSLFNRSAESLSISHSSDTSCPDELQDMDTSFLASGSHCCSNSGNGSSGAGRTFVSPRSSSNGTQCLGRHDSAGSFIGTGPEGELSKSNRSSFNSRISGSSIHVNQRQDFAAPKSEDGYHTLSLRSRDSSIDIETAEKMEELHDEVKMWERHSRQLKHDIEILKKEISDKSKHQVNLDMELAAAYKEKNSLKQEVEQLKIALKESISKRTNTATDESQEMTFSLKNQDMINMQEELKDELKLLKESNATLTLQLSKSQESNIELVCIVQDLEQTIEKQKLESEKFSQKNHETINEEILQGQNLLDREAEHASKLFLKEEEMFKFEKLSNTPNTQQTNQIELKRSYSDLKREIEVLKAKLQEVEKDQVKLTDENLDLTFTMKELYKDIREEKDSHGFRSSESQGFISKDELELHITKLEQENVQLLEHISGLETHLGCLTNAKQSTQLELENSRSLISDLKEEIERKQAEVEMQQMDANQRLRKSQKLLSEALQEYDILKISNSSLQASIDSLIEECSSLQNLNADLKMQKMELHDHVMHLEVELDQSRRKVSEFSNQVKNIEAKLSSLQIGIASKEKSLLSQLENLFQEHKEYKKKLSQTHAMLKKIESDKTSKTENLQRELAHLSEQISSDHREQEQIQSDAKEASCANGAESKSEIYQMQRENNEYRRMIQSLQDEIDKLTRKTQFMEKELMLIKEHKQDNKVCSEVNEKPHGTGTSHVTEVYRESKTQQHGLEFAEVMESNNMLKLQAKRFSTEEQIDDSEILKKIMTENKTMTTDTNKIPSLEAELKDMKERYLHMSLQYAQVEAQREELVLKLKSMQKERRWFS
ncbi:unnamed protein product [Musa hybrid cultivar]